MTLKTKGDTNGTKHDMGPASSQPRRVANALIKLAEQEKNSDHDHVQSRLPVLAVPITRSMKMYCTLNFHG